MCVCVYIYIYIYIYNIYIYIIQVNFMHQRVGCTLLSCLLGFNFLMDVNPSFEGRMLVVALMF